MQLLFLKHENGNSVMEFCYLPVTYVYIMCYFSPHISPPAESFLIHRFLNSLYQFFAYGRNPNVSDSYSSVNTKSKYYVFRLCMQNVLYIVYNSLNILSIQKIYFIAKKMDAIGRTFP